MIRLGWTYQPFSPATPFASQPQSRVDRRKQEVELPRPCGEVRLHGANHKQQGAQHRVVEVTITADGSCIGNPGPGAWACILRSGDREKELFGSHPETTSNRMELTAAIEGLRALRAPCRIRLVTDSQYVKKGITEHLPKWRSNGFGKSNGDPVLNQDLWLRREVV